MRSVVVVCTRNRPDDVRRVLGSCAAQVPVPHVLVVDSSDDGATHEVVDGLGGGFVSYLRSEPGLTRQRIAGVGAVASDTEVVHFIDDDVVLGPGYFEEIEKAFERHPNAMGVGGLISNLGVPNHWWWRRIFGLASRQGGVVLASGVNLLVFHADADLRVQWLSGCAMSYRLRIFESLSFDKRMNGYSVGEDVEFSYRVSLLGEVWVTPSAMLEHLCSSVEREGQHRVARMEAVARYRRVSEMRGQGLTLTAFWWSMAGDIILNTVKGIVRLRRYPLRRAAALMAAVIDIARVGRVEKAPLRRGVLE